MKLKETIAGILLTIIPATAAVNTTVINETTTQAVSTAGLLYSVVGSFLELAVVVGIIIIICAAIGLGFKVFRIMLH